MQKLFLKKRYILVFMACLSGLFYYIDYQITGNVKDVGIGFLGNLAFLPIYVIFVAVMFEQIMRERERLSVMSKLNMVIGVFFSEVGNHLLRDTIKCVVSGDSLRQELKIDNHWKDNEFKKSLNFLKGHDYKISCTPEALIIMNCFLLNKRQFLVGLLENQTLLEHDQFTDLLWAVFHLTEELNSRTNFEDIPQTDIEHLNGDIKRAFGHLSREWVLYMKHLKCDYPYLFSLAVRMNPMLENPDVHVY